MGSIPIVLNPLALSGFIANPNGFPYAVGPSLTSVAGLPGVVLPSGASSTGVAFTMGSGKLATLTWNGVNYLDASQSEPSAVNVFSVDSMGNQTSLSVTPTSTTTSGNTITQNYAWGSIVTTYAASGDDLNVTITLHNSLAAGNTIWRYWLFSAALAFPNPPYDLNSNLAFSVDSPAVAYKAFNGGSAAIVSTDVTKQIGTGFWQTNNPPGPDWLMMVFVDPTQSGPNPNWPAVTRPVAPGTSEVFNLSIRFGIQNQLQQTLASDVYSSFAAAYPRTVTHAPLNPIAMLFLGGRVRPYPVTNPRCWNNGDPTIDVTTPAGLAAFRSSVMGFANSAITEMTRVQTQTGCPVRGILWDLEGYQTDETFLGSPPLIESFAPELAGSPNLLDALVNAFLNAGFEMGFTLRPQNTTITTGVLNSDGAGNLTWVSGSNFDPTWVGSTSGNEISFGTNNYTITAATTTTMTISPVAPAGTNLTYVVGQQTNTNPLTVLSSKILYALNRWDPTYRTTGVISKIKHFYVDSTLDYKGNFTPASVFQSLTSTYSGITIYPENVTPKDYAYTYPWTDSRGSHFQFWPADPEILMIYPDAFGAVRVESDANIGPTQPDLQRAVNAGSNLLFEGWFNHPANNVVITVYQNAVPPPPVLTIGCGSPPSGIVGTAYTTTFPASGGTPGYTFALATGAFPTGLTLNTSTGVLSGTPTTAGTYTFTVQVTDSRSVVATTPSSCTITIGAALAIGCGSPPSGTAGVSYTTSFPVTGGVLPYTWSIASGSLPPGITLNTTTGVASGTPTTPGTYTFTPHVIDGASSAASTPSPCSIVIAASSTLALGCGSPPSGQVGTPYTTTLAPSGGIPAYSFSIHSGSLPTGLSLNTSTGVISGTPTVAGTYTFTPRVTDSTAATADTPSPCSIVIAAAPTLTIGCGSPPAGNVGAPYSVTFPAAGGVPPYTFSLASGSFPPGLTLNTSTGVLSGTPTTAGTYTFTPRVTDSLSVSANTPSPCSIVISGPATLVILNTPPPIGQIGVPYSFQFHATGGVPPYTWSLNAGSGPLPAGLVLNGSTGVISGTPTHIGTSNFVLKVTDSA